MCVYVCVCVCVGGGLWKERRLDLCFCCCFKSVIGHLCCWYLIHNLWAFYLTFPHPSSTVKCTKLGSEPAKTVYRICKEYKIHNAEVLFRDDHSVDELIDVIEGNRHYVKCIYVYNKCDQLTVEQIDAIARRPHHVVLSCTPALNHDGLLHACWRYLGYVCF